MAETIVHELDTEQRGFFGLGEQIAAIQGIEDPAERWKQFQGLLHQLQPALARLDSAMKTCLGGSVAAAEQLRQQDRHHELGALATEMHQHNDGFPAGTPVPQIELPYADPRAI